MDVYLLLGTNLGDKRKQLEQSIQALHSCGQVIATSDIYETEAWGFESDHSFLNQAVLMRTEFLPNDLIDHILQIEYSLGRTRTSNSSYTDRVIDIDILFIDDLIITSPKLTVPHPRLHERSFVLTPLAELAPRLWHPILNKTIQELQIELSGAASS